MNLDPLDEYMEKVYNRKINNAKQEGELIGLEKGKLKTEEAVNKSMLEVAKTMIKKNFSKKDIMDCTKITEEQFLTL